MKALRNLIIPLIAVVVTAGLVLNFSGCANNSPYAPEDQGLSNQSELHLIPLQKEEPALHKNSSKQNQVSEWVTWRHGGKLTLKRLAKDMKVVVDLRVLPHTISQDAKLTLKLDYEKLDMTFGPEGIIFLSKPALLNISAKGLDLSGGEPDKIDIYYYNPDTNEWEKAARKAVIVKQKQGIIRIIDAEIPHFSRYAVGWGE